MTIRFDLNGVPQRCDVPPHWTLLRMLRDSAGHTDAKHGCGEGVCGACAVFVDGVAVNSCSVLAPQVEGAAVETVAGLERDGELHPLQAEMVARGGVQCGFCTPGMVISAIEAVRIGAAGSEPEIRHSLAGNLCRCTGYGKIVGRRRRLSGRRARRDRRPRPRRRSRQRRHPGHRPRPRRRGRPVSGVEVQTGRRVVGSDLARHDAIEKVAGRTSYAADFALPGMLHARLKRSDYAHARLTRVDTEAAEAIDGVVAVYTAADVPQNTVWVDVPGQTLEVGALKARSNVLADEVVRYHGEPIALVAAESDDAALAALDAIEVDYEPLPVVDDPERALDDDAPALHESGNLLAHWELEEGDVEAAIGAAEVLVEDEYRTQFIDHAYLEPEAGVSWRDTDGVITIRAATQVVEHFRDVARILDLPDNKVRVITPYVGGGFGGKEDMTVEPYLGIVVALTGRPARMVWSRQESLQARQNRHAVRMRYRTAADAEGRLVAMDVDILSDGGAYALLSALVLLYSTTCAAGPYRCPNVRIRARTVYTNHTPCSAMRGFGGMQVTLGYEGQMDRLAAKLGIDPLELRRRNFVERGDTLPIGQPLETSVELPALIDAVSERLGALPEPSGPRRAVGRGYACNLQPYGRCVWLNDWSSAWIGFELDGTLVIRIAVPDIGGGQASSLIQIASEVLGVAPERIAIHIGDSALNPLTGTTTATRQLYMSGNAVHTAAQRAPRAARRGRGRAARDRGRAGGVRSRRGLGGRRRALTRLQVAARRLRLGRRAMARAEHLPRAEGRPLAGRRELARTRVPGLHLWLSRRRGRGRPRQRPDARAALRRRPRHRPGDQPAVASRVRSRARWRWGSATRCPSASCSRRRRTSPAPSRST